MTALFRLVPPPIKQRSCSVCGIALSSPAVHQELCPTCWYWCQLGAALRAAGRWFREERP